MHFAQGLVVYEACAGMWAAFNLMHPQVGDRIRERMVELWKGATPWGRVTYGTGLLLSLQVWPAWLVFTLMPSHWTPKLSDRLATFFRREYLDRDGLLKPQMPASRATSPARPAAVVTSSCAAHGIAALGHAPEPELCGECQRVWLWWRCSACAPAFVGDAPLCPYCVPRVTRIGVSVDVGGATVQVFFIRPQQIQKVLDDQDVFGELVRDVIRNATTDNGIVGGMYECAPPPGDAGPGTAS